MSTLKKRKRESPASEITCKVSTSMSLAQSPVLVSYPAIQGPTSIAFQRYAKQTKTDNTDGKDSGEHSILVVGETEEMEFVSNQTETQRVAQAGCRYIVAVFDRETSALNLFPASKTPHILTQKVKNLKSVPLPRFSSLQYQEAKNALGEAFGTKKAKANIRAMLRNRVDVGAMEGVIDYLQQGIEKGAASLLTKDEADEAANSNRLIPPFDACATDPEQIYPLHGIIPEMEWKALSLAAFEAANGHKEKLSFLPYRYSDWIVSHVKGITGKVSKGKQKNLKIIMYISAMFAFRKALQSSRGAGIDNDQLAQKMTGVPGIVMDGLLARFAESPRGSSTHKSTSGTELNLLTHMFALCLKVDGFTTDPSILAHDLSLASQRINQIFKSLGCKIRTLDDRERAQFGLPDSAGNTRYAVLTAPVVFPKTKTTKRNTS